MDEIIMHRGFHYHCHYGCLNNNNQRCCLMGARSPSHSRLVHARQQVAVACRSDMLQRQIVLCVLENFCENLLSPQQNFVAPTCCKKSMKSDRICATCCGDKILLQRQRFSQKFSWTHKGISHCDVLQ